MSEQPTIILVDCDEHALPAIGLDVEFVEYLFGVKLKILSFPASQETIQDILSLRNEVRLVLLGNEYAKDRANSRHLFEGLFPEARTKVVPENTEISPEAASTLVEELNLDTSTYNLLRRLKFATVEDLFKRSFICPESVPGLARMPRRDVIDVVSGLLERSS